VIGREFARATVEPFKIMRWCSVLARPTSHENCIFTAHWRPLRSAVRLAFFPKGLCGSTASLGRNVMRCPFSSVLYIGPRWFSRGERNVH
jgi:hypothetical protein